LLKTNAEKARFVYAAADLRGENMETGYDHLVYIRT
jgi:hypothetical protein